MTFLGFFEQLNFFWHLLEQCRAIEILVSSSFFKQMNFEQLTLLQFKIFYSFRPKIEWNRTDMAKVRLPGRMQPSRLFLRPLSLKYTIPHSRFFKKNWLFKLKYDIFEEYFRNLLRFSQICRETFKIILNPSPQDIYLMFGMNLRPWEHSKLLIMAPD